MRVGVSLFFQNYADFDRHMAGSFGERPAVPDDELFRDDLALGDLVEELGFDSLWTVEHHFTPYAMTDSPLQVLSYFAGRTSRIDLGTMVVVLPWHEPLRVAEEIALLDHFAGGRRLMLGFGRGASQLEFGRFRIDREESRDRLTEALDIVRLALTEESFSYASRHYDIPETSIRPRPRTPDLTRHMFCAWNSPETMEFAARSGLGQMFITLKSWEEAAEQAITYNKVRIDAGWEPTAPISVIFVCCTESEADASAAATSWLPNMMDASIRHYGILDGMEGPPEELHRMMCEGFTGLNLVGPPDACYDRLAAIQQLMGSGEFIMVFKYGAMPAAVAERSMRLFAESVLPRLHAIPADLPASTPFAEVRSGRPG
jgi:alkanesulfonate monooxygenase SsuD/methylene tetrahydromethanopterin reductase-like flavin-dependent oxidoreductase (luciferase family)